MKKGYTLDVKDVEMPVDIIINILIFMKNILYSNYFNSENINIFFLTQHTEYSIDGRDIMFYNTLFDSLLLANFKSADLALRFVKELEKGCRDIHNLISECFDKDVNKVYALLVQKKIIE